MNNIFADLFTFDILCTNCLDACLGVSAKTFTAIAGALDDEEQVGASTPIRDMDSPEAKQIRSWSFIA